MNKFKRLTAMLLAVVMTVTMLAACGNKVEEPPVDDPVVTDQQVPDVTPSTDTTVDTDPMVTTAPDTEPTVSDTEPTTLPDVTDTTPTQKPDTTTEDDGSFTVEDMSATMYATDSVNVRSGPSAGYDKIGRFDKNEAVTVTGRASTGWFRVDIDGKTGYVSNAYLTDKKPSDSTTTQKPSDGSDDEPDVDLGDEDNPLTTFEGFGDAISDNQLDYIISNIKDERYATVIREILEGIQNFQMEINVSPLISEAEAQEFQNQIIPIIAVEYCYVDSIVGGKRNGMLSSVTVKYHCNTIEEGIGMVNKLRNKTNSVLKNVKSSWSDYKKVEYIHDWLVLNCTPDPDNIGGPWASNAYGAIVDGRPTCLGYAKATFYMLSKLGFDVAFDIGMGTTAKHIWVKVKVDGSWYNVDTTWDDPTSGTKEDPNYVSHIYFMQNDDFMTNTHADNFDMIFFNEPNATKINKNWFVANDCYIESASDAEKILKNAAKKAIEGGNEYEYVQVFCSSVDVYDSVLSTYGGKNKFNSKIMASVSSKYSCDQIWGGTKSDFPDFNTRCLTFRLKK